MKKIGIQLSSYIIILVMLFNLVVPYNTYAFDRTIESDSVNTNISNDEGVITESEDQDISQNETDSDENKVVVERLEENETSYENTQGISPEEEQFLIGDSSLVNYFYVGSPYLETPSTQQFVLSYGDGKQGITSVELLVQKDGDQETTIAGILKGNGIFVFEQIYENSQSGNYTVNGFIYSTQEKDYKVLFSDLKMDIRFGVNQEYDGYGESEGYTIDENGQEIEITEVNEDISMSVVSVDGTEMETTTEMLKEAVSDNLSQNGFSTYSSITKSNSIEYTKENPLIICIDPGHGGADSGTSIVGMSSSTGTYEKHLNLKIANYLKAELEQYKNVKVVMTRTGDTNPSLQQRAQIAANAGATALVSIHINATGVGNPSQSFISGAEIYYPNSNYDTATHETGKNLAQNIMNQLVGLGIKNNGIKVKYVYDPTTGLPANDPTYDYPDGSVGDYYGVIRYSKQLGVAGIIVEHCFADNYNDVNTYLMSEQMLKNMGVADATGIANAFGLRKSTDRDTINDFANKNKNSIADGTYSLVDLSSSKFAGIQNASLQNDANVVLHESVNADYLGWRIVNNEDGYVLIQNVYSGKVLSVDEGRLNSKVVQKESENTYNKLWIIEKTNNGNLIYSATDTDYLLGVSNNQLVLTSKDDATVWNFNSYNQRMASVLYESHIQNLGWQAIKQNGNTSGTTNTGYPIEAIKVQLSDNLMGTIQSKVNVDGLGWTEWNEEGQISGTTGKRKPLKAISFRLQGEVAEQYDIYYRVFLSGLGWLGWAKNGSSAGVQGLDNCVEAVEIKLTVKGGVAPGNTNNAFVRKSISYQTHIENTGWQDWKHDGQTSGTVGESSRLEAISIKLEDLGFEGGVRYKTHIEDIGWQDWKSEGQMSGTSGQSKRLEAIKIELSGELSHRYDIYYRVHAQNFGWLDWAKNGDSAGTEGYAYRLEAIEIVLVEKGGNAPGNTDNPFYSKTNKGIVTYGSYVEGMGWQDTVANGETSGTTDQSKRIEGLKIYLNNPEGIEGSIQYRAHVENIGWQNWVENGNIAGTTGNSLQLEAIQIELTGQMAELYDVYYRVHVQDFGWLGWACNGSKAGTEGYEKQAEAIEIVLVEKGGNAPGNTDKPFICKKVSYQVHVQNEGWQSKKSDGETSGTQKKSLRLEAIKITIPSLEDTGSVQYRTHIQNLGWQNWKRDGELSGTTGESLRLEAIQIELTGELANKYDIYYRVHAQNFGWLGWAKNGESAGTEGYAYRLEAIEIIMLEKGSEAPGSTSNAFYNKNGAQEDNETKLTPIMGESTITVQQMVNLFKKNNSSYDKNYNSGSSYNGVLAKGGASTIEQFCQIYYEEAKAEGVRVDVAFSQAMLETGWLKFGGDVKPNQYNFAGLGATGGVPGNSFPNVRTGIRAQIQHLKCYASTLPLNNENVDPRWGDWLRGKAEYVEYLSQVNNPFGIGWATSATYSENILRIMSQL